MPTFCRGVGKDGMSARDVSERNRPRASSVTSVGPLRTQAIWPALRHDALILAADTALTGFTTAAILAHQTFAEALASQLARKLADDDLGERALADIVRQVHAGEPSQIEDAEHDLVAVLQRDPACRLLAAPFLFHKGYLALQTYRVAHGLWREGRQYLAGWLQSRASQAFHVDIHPAAEVGRGIFIDHGTGVVVGETAVIGDEVSLLQGVTLGGTGARTGPRHPKIGRGVQLFAGAQVLGDVRVGDEAKIGARSLVLRDVPAGCTAVGVPARIVKPPADAGLRRREFPTSPRVEGDRDPAQKCQEQSEKLLSRAFQSGVKPAS